MILKVSWDGLSTLSFGLSQFHGHGSWLMCEIAVSMNCQMLTQLQTRLLISCAQISEQHILDITTFNELNQINVNCVTNVLKYSKIQNPFNYYTVYCINCHGH